jgi:hypothetical protein
MTFARWTGSSWTTLTTFRRWTGSVWQTLANGSRWTGSSWSSFGFLQASLSPLSANGSRNTSGVIHTTSCTTTATNGSGSYTYAWNVITTTGRTISADTPSLATTTFSANLDLLVSESVGSATCTVTDTVTGATAVTSNSVSIDILYTGGS